MEQAYIMEATVEDRRHLHLDESLPLSAERVRVTVETLPPRKPKSSFTEVVGAIHARLTVVGHVSPTRVHVDAYLNEERNSWGH